MIHKTCFPLLSPLASFSPSYQLSVGPCFFQMRKNKKRKRKNLGVVIQQCHALFSKGSTQSRGSLKRNGYYVQRLPVVSCLLGSRSWHEAQRVIKHAKPKRGAEGKKHKSLPPPSHSFLWIKLQGFRGLRTYPPAHLSLLFTANLRISHTRNLPDIQPSRASEST